MEQGPFYGSQEQVLPRFSSFSRLSRNTLVGSNTMHVMQAKCKLHTNSKCLHSIEQEFRVGNLECKVTSMPFENSSLPISMVRSTQSLLCDAFLLLLERLLSLCPAHSSLPRPSNLPACKRSKRANLQQHAPFASCWFPSANEKVQSLSHQTLLLWHKENNDLRSVAHFIE